MAAPAPLPHVPGGTSGRGTALWLAALLAALALIGWDTAQNWQRYTRTAAEYGVAVRAPAADPASPTGFAHERRTFAYPSRWVDAQHWIIHTQRMLADGEWRVRRVMDDNAPDGRELHWPAPFRWWLGFWALMDHGLTGQPTGSAVERAALFANPALLALLLLLVVPWTARRFGAGAAAFLALAMVGTPPLYVLFAPDNMDHHGLIQALLMVMLLALLAGGCGCRRTKPDAAPAWSWLPNARQARRAFVISGICGGLGLWVSAASMIPALAGMGLGALAGAWFGRRAPDFAGFDPGLWRLWARVGGATAFVSWLVEYAPSDFSWRLEVNHPVYALAWIGAGEVLAQAAAWLAGNPTARDRGAWFRLGAGLAAVAVPIAMIAVAGARVFTVADPFLWSLGHDYTPESKGLSAALRTVGFNADTAASCLPMLALIPAGLWLAQRRVPGLVRAVAAVPFMTTVLFWVMALREFRWWAVGFGGLFLLVVILAVTAASVGLKRGQLAAGWLAIVILFAPGLAAMVKTVAANAAVQTDDLYSLAERDLAHSLRQRVGGGPLVVLAAPATTSRLIYFGGARGLGTAYWENLPGMKRAAAIFAAPTPEQARELLRAAGVTHIVLLSWDDFVEPYVRLVRGLRPEAALTEPAFGLELQRQGTLPPWLQRLPDHLPELPLFHRKWVAIFEVTDRTRPEQALVRTVRDLLYRGHVDAARERIPELMRHPDDLAAQVTLARIQFVARDRSNFETTLQRVEALRAQASMLETEDRMDLVSVFAFASRHAEVRQELAATLQAMNESTLRRLTPGSLRNLLGLSARLGLTWPDPRLQELAGALLPPDGRL